MYCPQCRSEYDDGAKYCHKCGQRLPEISLEEVVLGKLNIDEQPVPQTRVEAADLPSTKGTPYPWGNVMKWTGGGFIAGIFFVHVPHSSSLANTMALKILGGITWGALLGITIGIYKFFRR